jgi:hypothetical protein
LIAGQPAFDYDVAFSFLARDEGLALQLNDLLQDRVRTFIYTERQKELAGKDGEIAFGSVFGAKARFVALLYRAEWGETPWTRIEETAIRNRGYDEAYDFLLCIPLDDPPHAPKWIPRNKLWIGLERWGLEGAAAVIEARVQELGGQPAIETIGSKAARLSRKQEFERSRQQFIDSSEGVQQANEAVASLKAMLKKLGDEIAGSHKGLPLNTVEVRGSFLLRGLGPVMVMDWSHPYSNTLKHSELKVEFCDRIPVHLARVPRENHQTLEETKPRFDWIEPGRAAWVVEDWKRSFTSEELASELLKRYMDFAEHHEP